MREITTPKLTTFFAERVSEFAASGRLLTDARTVRTTSHAARHNSPSNRRSNKRHFPISDCCSIVLATDRTCSHSRPERLSRDSHQ